MNSVPSFRNTRLDATGHERLRDLAVAGAAAFGYTAELKLDRDLARLLRLRVAQLNNCPYCLVVHHAAARDSGLAPVKIETLTSWWETGLFSDAEQAALAYAEALTRVADATESEDFQQVHERMSSYFDEEERLEIVGVVINMNIWTRLKLAEGARPAPVEP
jgi:AhpD family alkylhydroperoxidase